jgi:hypothetical protein
MKKYVYVREMSDILIKETNIQVNSVVEKAMRLSKFTTAQINQIEAKEFDELPVKEIDHVKFQYCQDLSLVHFDST